MLGIGGVGRLRTSAQSAACKGQGFDQGEFLTRISMLGRENAHDWENGRSDRERLSDLEKASVASPDAATEEALPAATTTVRQHLDDIIP